ncbi:hypothetical protein TorRG33x02_318160 [Trema orientale]|uniref:Uncharacterized protein n=1 Tax=Trema orientale TaxID=63057 RepID=A0A2P5BKA7_TREOI|nr:hypothetical protein TorRG33x02_318160 [Trema orientale]
MAPEFAVENQREREREREREERESKRQSAAKIPGPRSTLFDQSRIVLRNADVEYFNWSKSTDGTNRENQRIICPRERRRFPSKGTTKIRSQTVTGRNGTRVLTRPPSRFLRWRRPYASVRMNE